MTPSRPISRTLFRTCAILGAIIALLSAVLIAPIQYTLNQRDITISAQRYNESLATALSAFVRGDIKRLLDVAHVDQHHGASSLRIRKSLDRAFSEFKRDPYLLKVKLFAADGHVIYSTDREDIGVMGDADDAGFALAFHGHVTSSSRSFRPIFNAIGGILADRSVVSSYIPIFDSDDSSQMTGVFEIYSDITERDLTFYRSLVFEMLLTFAVVATGYAGLLLAIWLGARDIDRAHGEKLKLTEAVARVRATSESRTQLLMSMSHHLKTPLNAIIGFSEMIQGERCGPLGDRRYALYAADILDSGRQLLGGVDNILEYIRAETCGGKTSTDELSPLDALQGAMQEAKPFADTAQVSLICAAQTEDNGYITTDTRRVRRILRHVIDNAIRYNRPGGHVWLSVGLDALGATFVVADDGFGIPPEELPGVFVPFGVKGQVLTQESGGFGIGLPLSKRLADHLGGTLTVASRPEGGTVVTLTLPASLPASNPASNSAELAA